MDGVGMRAPVSRHQRVLLSVHVVSGIPECRQRISPAPAPARPRAGRDKLKPACGRMEAVLPEGRFDRPCVGTVDGQLAFLQIVSVICRSLMMYSMQRSYPASSNSSPSPITLDSSENICVSGLDWPKGAMAGL